MYTAGVRNGNDGFSLLSIADAALVNLSDIVVRITELEAIGTGFNSNKQREALENEAQVFADEYWRITKTTEFNGVKLFDGSLGEGVQLQLGYSRGNGEYWWGERNWGGNSGGYRNLSSTDEREYGVCSYVSHQR